jgi:hypothetical protein
MHRAGNLWDSVASFENLYAAAYRVHGKGDDCPADAKSIAECRPAAGVCDLAEACDGLGPDCPADLRSTAECRPAAGVCDKVETCDGAGVDCPEDVFLDPTVTCREAAGNCDVAETCAGAGAACPPDAKAFAECRPSAGPCDLADYCDGVADDCPEDAFVLDGTSCADTEFCNGLESCLSGACSAGVAVDCGGLGGDCRTGVCREDEDGCGWEPAQEGLACDDLAGWVLR